MPLTEKGEKIKGSMVEQYGQEKGEEVFYASKNAGKITGVDTMKDAVGPGHIANAVGFDRRHDADDKKKDKEEDLPTQLETAEAELEAMEREQEQTEEGQERVNAIDDHKKHIRSLRDAIKSQARDALTRAGAKNDALEELEAKQDAEAIMQHCADAAREAADRFDALAAGRA
jgi:hypothetical protein